jgi:hypothetical protein
MLTISIDLENAFICGMTQIKDYLVVCQMSLPRVESRPVISSVITVAAQPNPESKTPELCIYRGQNECLMRDKLSSFGELFPEVQYKLVSSGKPDGNCFIHNPEMLMRVQPISLQDRIEYLVTKKR